MTIYIDSECKCAALVSACQESTVFVFPRMYGVVLFEP